MHTLTRLGLAIGVVAVMGCAVAAPRGEEATAMDFPKVVLENAGLRLTVYLPDAAKGFYRGMRFDWSGLVARAEFDGRTVYGPFRTTYDATNHDNVVGPAEEFDMDSPPGWDEAKPGEGFMKIGVGILRKLPPLAKEKQPKDYAYAYGFWLAHEILDGGAWKVERGKDWVEFRHTLSGPRTGVRLHQADRRGGPPAGLHHPPRAGQHRHPAHRHGRLQPQPNASRRRTRRARLPYHVPVRPEGEGGPRPRRVQGPQRRPAEGTPGRQRLGGVRGGRLPGRPAHGYPGQHATGTGVTLRGDRPVAEWRFYAEKTAACPEPFVRLRVEPGKTETWQVAYALLAGKPAVKP